MESQQGNGDPGEIRTDKQRWREWWIGKPSLSRSIVTAVFYLALVIAYVVKIVQTAAPSVADWLVLVVIGLLAAVMLGDVASRLRARRPRSATEPTTAASSASDTEPPAHTS